MEIEPAKWAPLAIKYINAYEKTGKVPMKYSVVDQAVGIACFPIFCGVCVGWSTVFRILACPIQCACRGPWYACSNNGCTVCSDFMIASCCDEYEKKARLPPLKVPRILTPENMKAILSVVDRIESLFTTETFSGIHYTLADNIVKPIAPLADFNGQLSPSRVPGILASIKTRLGVAA